MKTKFIKKFFVFLFIFVSTNLKADSIFFESENIRIEEDGNIIFATQGVAKIPERNLTIYGDKFIYDRKNLELIIFDNVKYVDDENNIIIESQKMIYNELENQIFSQNKTFIEVENKYKINSTNILYDRKLKKISSQDYTEVQDKIENKFTFNKGLIFDTFEEIISSQKILIKDQNFNQYFFENSKINLKLNEIIGKEIKIDFFDSFFGNENNDPT